MACGRDFFKLIKVSARERALGPKAQDLKKRILSHSPEGDTPPHTPTRLQGRERLGGIQ
ncbi:MAG: hypothetical protein QXO15_02965 [Nitrososphaerota archaeon]